MGAEQDQRLAAVLQQARHGAALVAAGSGRAPEREFVVGVVGGGVEAADEVAVKGCCTSNTTPISRLRVLRSSRARLSGR